MEDSVQGFLSERLSIKLSKFYSHQPSLSAEQWTTTTEIRPTFSDWRILFSKMRPTHRLNYRLTGLLECRRRRLMSLFKAF